MSRKLIITKGFTNEFSVEHDCNKRKIGTLSFSKRLARNFTHLLNCICLSRKAVNKKNSRKTKDLDECALEISLPDDLIEMILGRSNFQTITVARCVCKKRNEMITSSQFMLQRQKLNCNSSWLFLFGCTFARNCFPLEEVFALDTINNNLVKIHSLKDRLLYSVTNIGSEIYIVGGWNMGDLLKEVAVLSPLTNSCREISPMNVPRSRPILGVFELDSTSHVFQNRKTKQVQNQSRLNTGNAKFALVIVGGSKLESMEFSGEIYDPSTDKWTNISSIAEEFGSQASTGVVRGNNFYIYSKCSNKLASYNIETGSWALIQTEQPPCTRYSKPRLISCKNRIFMCCICWSNRTEQATRMLWEFNTEMNRWSMVSELPDAPMDRNALFCVGGDRIYGLEMFPVLRKTPCLTVGHICDDGVVWSRIRERVFERTLWTSMVVMHL